MAEANPHHTLSETEVAHIAAQKAVNGHTITDVKIEGTTVNGNLGAYFRVELTIKEDGDEPRKHSLFMKSMPSECWKVDFLVNEGVFQKEVNFYKDISGLFRKYLSVDVCPRCFLADPGKIVLEDASREGYRPWRGITEEPLDYDHTKLVSTLRVSKVKFAFFRVPPFVERSSGAQVNLTVAKPGIALIACTFQSIIITTVRLLLTRQMNTLSQCCQISRFCKF